MDNNTADPKKVLTRADLLLILILLVVGAGLLFWQQHQRSGMLARVLSDNEVIAELPLDRNTVFPVITELGTNTVVIENGEAYMIDADCPDKICEQMGRISKPGETIVCLPHKLIVEIGNAYGNE